MHIRNVMSDSIFIVPSDAECMSDLDDMFYSCLSCIIKLPLSLTSPGERHQLGL